MPLTMLHQRTICWIAILLIAFSGLPVRAQIIESKGVGEVLYSGVFGLSTADEQKALRLAQSDALARHLATLSSSKRAEFARFKAILDNEPQRFVKVGRVLDETKDSTQRRYVVTIRAEINVPALEDLIGAGSAVRLASETERSGLIFVVMSRKAAGVRQFDDKRTERTDRTQGTETSESANATDNRASASRESTNVAVTVTGGSTETKSDQIQYQVSSSEDINSTITRVFTDAGFTVAEGEMLEPETVGKDGRPLLSIEAFRNDFSRGADVSAATRVNAGRGLKTEAVQKLNMNIRFLLVGSLDVGRNLRDPASGLMKVFVNVNAKVYDTSKALPTTAATIGPVQYAGLGPTQEVAERNALREAGETAANELVSQMRAKNLK
jgi:hypothetical protein